jgi:hypothetical protein
MCPASVSSRQSFHGPVPCSLEQGREAWTTERAVAEVSLTGKAYEAASYNFVANYIMCIGTDWGPSLGLAAASERR